MSFFNISIIKLGIDYSLNAIYSNEQDNISQHDMLFGDTVFTK